MIEHPTPEHFDPPLKAEILPPTPADERPGLGESGFSIYIGSRDGHRRVYVAKPGPFGTILLFVALGMLLAVSFVVLAGALALLTFLTCVFASGLLVNGLFRRFSRRR